MSYNHQLIYDQNWLANAYIDKIELLYLPVESTLDALSPANKTIFRSCSINTSRAIWQIFDMDCQMADSCYFYCTFSFKSFYADGRGLLEWILLQFASSYNNRCSDSRQGQSLVKGVVHRFICDERQTFHSHVCGDPNVCSLLRHHTAVDAHICLSVTENQDDWQFCIQAFRCPTCIIQLNWKLDD